MLYYIILYYIILYYIILYYTCIILCLTLILIRKCFKISKIRVFLGPLLKSGRLNPVLTQCLFTHDAQSFLMLFTDGFGLQEQFLSHTLLFYWFAVFFFCSPFVCFLLSLFLSSSWKHEIRTALWRCFLFLTFVQAVCKVKLLPCESSFLEKEWEFTFSSFDSSVNWENRWSCYTCKFCLLKA